MNTDNRATLPGYVPADESARIRDRVLLFTRGTAASATASVDIALESLRRAEAEATEQAPLSYESAMHHVFTLMHERKVPLFMRDDAGTKLTSAPPMNRRAMIAENMEYLSLTSLMIGGIRNMFRRVFSKTAGGSDS